MSDRSGVPGGRRRAGLWLGALTLAGSLLAACSSGGTTTTSTRPVPTTSATTTSATTTSATTTTAATATTGAGAATTTTSGGGGSTTTTSGAATAACASTGVTVVASTGQGAAGTVAQRFVVTNEGTEACTMEGYPSVRPFATQSGGSTVMLPISQAPVPPDFGDLGRPGGVVTLQPGGTAAFFVVYSEAGPPGCSHADGFEFRTPQAVSDPPVRSVTFSFVPCGSTIEVSQIFPPTVTA